MGGGSGLVSFFRRKRRKETGKFPTKIDEEEFHDASHSHDDDEDLPAVSDVADPPVVMETVPEEVVEAVVEGAAASTDATPLSSGGANTPSAYTMSPAPKIRSKMIAERTACFESPPAAAAAAASTKGGTSAKEFGLPATPPSSEKTNAKRHFWEHVFHNDDSSEEDLVQHNVMMKKKWLETAFTPQGGGNMVTEDPTEDMTESQNSFDVVGENSRQANNSGVYYSPPRVRRKQLVVEAQQVQDDDVWFDAYQVWHDKGLLPWRPERNPHSKPPPDSPTDATQSLSDQDSPPAGHTRTASGKWLLVETVVNASMEDEEEWTNRDEPYSPPPSVKAVRFVEPVDADALMHALKESRSIQFGKTQSSPLLTTYGGGDNDPTTVSTPRAVVRVQHYQDYVRAYKAYTKDRRSPEAARTEVESRYLLSVTKVM